jgi:hypothetical protein
MNQPAIGLNLELKYTKTGIRKKAWMLKMIWTFPRKMYNDFLWENQ